MRTHSNAPKHARLIERQSLWPARSALIVTLNEGLKPPFLTGIPHPIGENLRQIQATGTQTLWIKPDPPNVNLLDPEEILPALGAGYESRATGGWQDQGLLVLRSCCRPRRRAIVLIQGMGRSVRREVRLGSKLIIQSVLADRHTDETSACPNAVVAPG